MLKCIIFSIKRTPKRTPSFSKSGHPKILELCRCPLFQEFRIFKMAINASDYIQTKEKNIKLHKKNKRLFLFDFRVDGKRHRKFYEVKFLHKFKKKKLINRYRDIINIL